MTTASQVTGKELPVRSISRRGRVRPQRDFAAMEQRRMRAVDLFEQGVIPAEIARQVGVSHQIVSNWRGLAAVWSSGAARGGPSRTATETEQRATRRGRSGAGQRCRSQRLHHRCVDVAACGRGDRAAERGGLPPWTRVVPLARSVGLDLAAASAASRRTQRCGYRVLGQAAVAATEKRARRQNALTVVEDESGVSLLPSVRATWAPRGHTPVLNHRFNWKRVSLAGALAYEPDGSDAHLVSSCVLAPTTTKRSSSSSPSCISSSSTDRWC